MLQMFSSHHIDDQDVSQDPRKNQKPKQNGFYSEVFWHGIIFCAAIFSLCGIQVWQWRETIKALFPFVPVFYIHSYRQTDNLITLITDQTQGRFISGCWCIHCTRKGRQFPCFLSASLTNCKWTASPWSNSYTYQTMKYTKEQIMAEILPIIWLGLSWTGDARSHWCSIFLHSY